MSTEQLNGLMQLTCRLLQIDIELDGTNLVNMQ